MRLYLGILGTLVLVPALLAQNEPNFAGVWLLSKPLSDLRDLPRPAAEKIQIQQDAVAMKVDAGGLQLTYPLDGKPTKLKLTEESYNIAAKWEGSALLATIIVAGPDYSIQERWSKSKDGYRLTVERNVIRGGKENESQLVYLSPDAPPQTAVVENRATPRRGLVVRPPVDAAPAPAPIDAALPQEYLVKTGTRLLLRLTNDVNTKRTVPGDRLYLETAAPLFGDGKLILPVGTYVTALVTEAEQAGRVKGKSSLNVRFDTLTLPNGVTRNFDGRIATANVDGKLDKEEGRIEGNGGKGKDAKTVAKTGAATTGLGSVIGAAAGHAGTGAAVGAATGVAGALVGVLRTRGPEVVLPKGTTMEIELDRDLHFTAAELARIR